jgi:hypothetical protein
VWTGRRADPGRERWLLELIASGMTPNRAAGVAGMAVSTAYAVVRRSSGVPWREPPGAGGEFRDRL